MPVLREAHRVQNINRKRLRRRRYTRAGGYGEVLGSYGSRLGGYGEGQRSLAAPLGAISKGLPNSAVTTQYGLVALSILLD